MHVELTLNGAARAFDVPDEASLLELLRDDAGITSPKDGCSPQGQCGACLVLVDGHPKTSCAVPARTAAGKSVLTLEGVPEEERHIYGEAFARTAGLQCGFCIPGIALRMKSVLDANPDPTDEEIRRKLDPHLCRCTGYVKIVDAFHARGPPAPGRAAPAAGRLGPRRNQPRPVRGRGADARDEALRRRPVVPRDAPRRRDALAARAGPREEIDTSRAAGHPGVMAVVTARDVPGKRFVGLIVDDWPGFVAEGEETRYVGDVLAAVAAVDARTARAAAALVDVEYEVLPPVTDPEEALRPGAPRVGGEGNLLSRSVVKRGDVEAALAASAHVVEGTWQTQRIEHLYLEPEACLAAPGDVAGQNPKALLTLYTQGQGIFDDRRQVAAFLGLPEDEVHVVLVPNGGAFGGKEDMSIQAQTALLARVTGRPVRLVLSREESMRLHPKRHPIRMHYRAGCDSEGRLTGGLGPDDRRLGGLRVRRHEGARARGRPRRGSVQVLERGRRGAGRLHEQPALRRHARLRREPGPLRDGGRPGHAGREGRSRRLGDPVAKRARGGRRLVLRPEARRPPSASRRRSSPSRTSGRRTGGARASPAASRTAASETG